MFWFPRHKQKHHLGRFCSVICNGKWLSKSRKGSLSPLWKGGLTTLKIILRNSCLYNQWRLKCMIRDDFKCQTCGQIGGKLEVHHKKSLMKLLEESHNCLPLLSRLDAAFVYSPTWNVGNGITLCEKCHKKIPVHRAIT